MDFGVLPPEVNSGRMYAGPGAGPLLAAAAAWDGLAAQLHCTAASYASAISALAAEWTGPSSVAMAAAASPYTSWMSATAAQAEQSAEQARAAAAAYETAFAATVPPPIIAANRDLLMALIATNFVGQNTPAIAATEALYAEMWAQDAAAMFGYAGSSAAASQLTPFTEPPQTTNPAGTAAGHAQTAVSTVPQLMSAVPQSLQNLASSALTAAPTSTDPLSILDSLTGPFSPLSLATPALGGYLISTEPYGLASIGSNVAQLSQKVAALPAGAGADVSADVPGSGLRLVGSTAGVSADTGGASVVGRLSVPQGWVSAAPALKAAVTVLPESSLDAAPVLVAAEAQDSMFGNMALSGMAGRLMVSNDGAAARSINGGGGMYAGQATHATIIVLPPDE